MTRRTRVPPMPTSGPAAVFLLALMAPAAAGGLWGQGRLGVDFSPGLVPIAEGIYAYEGYIQLGDEEEVLRVNSMVVITDDGILIADGQPDSRGGREMLAAIRQLSDQPVRFLINCSPHGDHSGSNGFFSNAVVISHTAAREAIKASREYFDSRGAEFRPPEVTYSERMTLYLGGKRIELRFFGPGHTDGDTMVYLPEQHVAFLSELFFNGVFASLAEGHSQAHLGTLSKISGLDATWYLPGHGKIRGESPEKLAEGLRRHYETVSAVHNVVLEHVGNGDSLETTMGQADDELGIFSKLSFYRYLKERTITGVYQSLAAESGEK